jgi:hypothetical protein
MAQKYMLRPGVINPNLWFPERPPKTEWDRIRKKVLERDNYTCTYCGHHALKYMNIHHLEEAGVSNPANLATICVACHAVLHIGRNISLKVIEIWESHISQIEIVHIEREGILQGQSLSEINSSMKLKQGPYPPNSIQYADNLVLSMGNSSRAYLQEPLCAIFINLTRWQLE